MATRVEVRRPRRKLCIGDLRDRIILQSRDITEPAFGARDFDEDFKQQDGVWASIRTTAGKVFFDGVNTDIAVTHEIRIRYDSRVTAETWIELEDGRRLDVVNVEDLEERKEYLTLLCTERGLGDREAAKS